MRLSGSKESTTMRLTLYLPLSQPMPDDKLDKPHNELHLIAEYLAVDPKAEINAVFQEGQQCPGH